MLNINNPESNVSEAEEELPLCPNCVSDEHVGIIDDDNDRIPNFIKMILKLFDTHYCRNCRISFQVI